MQESSALSVMRRKLASRRGMDVPGVPSSARVWRMIVPKVADSLLGLQASVSSVKEVEVTPAELFADVAETSLILLAQGPSKKPGIFVVDAASITSLIEVQMTGRVNATPMVERRPTATDAALTRGLLDGICVAFDSMVADFASPPVFAGARVVAALPDARAALIALPEQELHVARISVDFGGGARQGQICVAMPATGVTTAELLEAPTGVGAALRPTLMESEIPLDVTLHRMEVAYDRACALAPGEVLTLPLSVIEKVALEALDGTTVARGKLGQSDGWKALRLEMPKAVGDQVPAQASNQMPAVDQPPMVSESRFAGPGDAVDPAQDASKAEVGQAVPGPAD